MPQRVSASLAVLMVAVTVATVAGSLVTWWLTGSEPITVAAPQALAIPVPADQQIIDIAIDPDGTTLAYTAVVDSRVWLFLRRLERFRAERVPGTDGAAQPFFAPDGTQLAYFADGALKRVGLDGGDPVEICLVPGAPAGGTWTPDGQIVFAPLGGQGLQIVSADGGSPLSLTELNDQEAEVAHGWPHVLPDGRSLLFTIGRSGRNPRLALLSLQSGERQGLVPAEGGASWVLSGHVVYARRGEVFALAVDTETLSVSRAPRVVADTAISSAAGYERLGHSSVAVARDGTLIYIPASEAVADTTLVWVDRQGHVTSLDEVAAPHQTPRISPDGEQIVVTIRTDPFTRDLWLYDTVANERRRLTAGAGDNHSPLWSPNGRQLAFASSREGPQRIFRMNATEGQMPETLIFGDARTPGSWSPDGRMLFFHETHPDRARDIWTWSADNGGSSRLIATVANERAPALSPDGRWLAYVSDDEAGDQIYIQPYPEIGQRQRISSAGGTEPVWSPDGSELFYRRGPEVHVVTIDHDTGTATSATRLFDGLVVTDPDGNLPAYDVSADGSRLLMLRPAARVGVLHLFRNWASIVLPADDAR